AGPQYAAPVRIVGKLIRNTQARREIRPGSCIGGCTQRIDIDTRQVGKIKSGTLNGEARIVAGPLERGIDLPAHAISEGKATGQLPGVLGEKRELPVTEMLDEVVLQ